MANYPAGTASVEITPDFRNFVRDLRTDLEGVEANLGVEIKAATAGFQRELDDYLNLVLAELGVEIKADTTNFASDLEAKLNLIAAALGVEINPDTTKFATDLETKLSGIHATFDVEVNPDTTDFAAELALRLAIINEAIKIAVDVDQASLDALEATIRAKLAAMDLHVDVKVGADTRVAADELAALKAAYREMTMNVDADTSAAAAQIAGLNSIPVTANVKADRGGLLSSFGGPLMLNVGALGASALPAVGTLVASIGADIQALTQNAALLPGLFAGAAAGIATLGVGMNNMVTAMGDGKKAVKAYEELSVQGKHMIDVAKSYGDEWGVAADRIQNVTLDGLEQPLRTMLDTQIPALERGMTGVATSMNAGMRGVLAELSNDKTVSAMDKVFGNTAEATGVLNQAITPVINSFRTLGTTGSTFLPQLAQNIVDVTTRFDAFLTRANESGDLKQWMQEGIDAGGKLFSVIGNIGSSLSSVFRAVKGDGDGFLTTVDKLTEKMSKWLGSHEGQTELGQFFTEGKESTEKWLPILESVGVVIGNVYQATQTWSGILLPFLQAASGLLASHGTTLQTLMVAYIAFKTVGPIFTLIGTAISGATGMLHNFQSGMANAAAAGSGGFKSAMSGVATALGTGGIFGIALAGAAIGLGYLATKHQEAKQAAAEQQAQLEALGRTLDETTGKATQATLTAASERYAKEGMLTRAGTLGINSAAFVRAASGVDPDAQAQINERMTQIILEQSGSAGSTWGQAKHSGLSDEEIAQALQGLPEAVKKYRDGIEAAQIELAAMGSEEKLPDLGVLKDAMNDIGESAATLGGEMNNAAAQTAQLGAQTEQASDAANGFWSLTEQGAQAMSDLGVQVIKVSDNTIALKGATAEQQQAMRDLGYSITELPDKTVVVNLNDEQARAQVVKLNSEVAAPVTKTVNIVYNGEFIKPEGQRQPLTPRATGGPITGGVPGKDSVPVLAMPGEHMLTTSDVDKLGGQEGVYRFRAALQAGLVKPMADGGAVDWDESDEIKLQQAQNAITLAEEKARRTDADPKKTDAEKRAAWLKVDEAREKAQKLENRKAGIGVGDGGTIAPQLELPALVDDSQLDVADAEARVDQANSKRNQIYADPESTDEEKAAADRDYIRAENARQSAVESARQSTGSQSGTGDADISLPGIAAKGAGILAEGILAMVGLENSVLSGNNVYTRSLNTAINFYTGKAQESVTGESSAGGSTYTPKNLPSEKSDSSSSSSSSGTKSAEDYDPEAGVEQWRGTFETVLRALSMPLSWLDLGMAQMGSESGGNPKAINLWDSNASKGIPSKGLM